MASKASSSSPIATDWDVGYRYDKTDQNDLTYGLFNLAKPAQRLWSVRASWWRAGVRYRSGWRHHPGLRAGQCAGPGRLDQPGCHRLHLVHRPRLFQPGVQGYYANISGEIAQLPAGALAFAAGYEYRKESGQFDPDAFIAA